MRRTTLAAVSWCGGFLMAATAASAYIRVDLWRSYGEYFQLGYVVGFLEGVALTRQGDPRISYVPGGGRMQHERWRALVNEFYADPANAKRPLPDAMQAVGIKIFEERKKGWKSTPEPQQSPAAPQALQSLPARTPAAG